MILPTQPQRNNQTDMNSRNNTTRNNAATKSYSQAVQEKVDNISNSSQVQQKVPIDTILQQILEKINKLDERISLMEQRLQGANLSTKMAATEQLRIMEWNANGLLQHRQELQTVLDIEKINVCFITETHFTKESFIKFRGYKIYHITHPENSARGVSAIII